MHAATTPFATSSQSEERLGVFTSFGSSRGITASPAELLQSLLKTHFDAVSRPAVLMLAKYIFNIWAAPLESKFRVIFLDNRLFLDRVQNCAGALAFLSGIGFVACDVSGRRALRLPIQTAPVSTSFANATALEEEQETAEAALLEPAVRALEMALVELQVPESERPTPVNRAAMLRQRKQDREHIPPVAFDPYKTYVRRVADVNPDGSVSITAIPSSGPGGSSTDARLATLAARRQELEGNLLDAAGEPTEVLLPANTASAKSGDNNVVVDADDERAPGDGRLLAAALMEKIKRPIDKTPFTTAALRALKKAQTELVYARTLVRVRLPERVVLQRRFHPRNTLQDVHQWVRSCLRDGTAFELYVAPPRQTLPDDITTLLDKQFVPATWINLSWLGGATSSCLLPHLLQSAVTGGGSPIPSGIALVADSAAIPAAGHSRIAISGHSAGASSMSLDAEAKSVPGPKKPSWFKL